MINLESIKIKKPISELLEFSIINIDKPQGPTSFIIDIILKNSLGLKKTSHFGTLDPMVSGVLPVSLNRACKLMPYFIGKNKTYVGIMRLHSDISRGNIEKEIKNFVGEIMQVPPKKSRVKRIERKRKIDYFKIIEIDKNNVLFETEVEAGTYIRKLIHDLGKKIGGAHMLELRRTKASIFDETDSLNIFDFFKSIDEYKSGNEERLRSYLIPGEIISKILPEVQVKKEYIKKLHQGFPLLKEYLLNREHFLDGSKISVFQDENFIGVYNIINKEDLFAKPEYVLQPIR
ncbi:MAG: RNA-guided pseudouridylation complex pseudouridine synthase subunit Cbf5 [Candidatus Pacearchaeota archaeon]